jgi:hypothetical protein
MKNSLRQFAVIITVFSTIAINILADALPINGLNTGKISDAFHVYFVPSGYVFAIWGLIYIGLLAYAVYQAIPSQKENPRLQATGWWVVLGGVANCMWIFLWHYELFIGTLAVMLVLLASLIATYLHLEIGETKVLSSETWLVRVPFSIYLGWITVATIANATDVLNYLKWNQFGLSDGTWMLIILLAVVVIAGLMIVSRRDIAYTAVVLWALAGIGVKFPQQGIITIGIWLSFGLVAAILVGSILVKRKIIQK